MTATHEELTGHRTLAGSIRDIKTERQAALALQAATAVAADANRAKSDFLANMSHEIRTPMNGVLGMTELMLDTELNPTQRHFAETLRGSATSLLTLLNDILDFSKIEAGKLTIEKAPFDVRQCVEEACRMLALQAAAKGLRFVVRIDPAIDARVLGDSNRLRQILVNLCGNAIKFTLEGSVVVEVFPLATQAGRTLLSSARPTAHRHGAAASAHRRRRGLHSRALPGVHQRDRGDSPAARKGARHRRSHGVRRRGHKL